MKEKKKTKFDEKALQEVIAEEEAIESQKPYEEELDKRVPEYGMQAGEEAVEDLVTPDVPTNPQN